LVISGYRVDLLRATTRSFRICDALSSIFILNSWQFEKIVVQNDFFENVLHSAFCPDSAAKPVLL